MNTSLPFDSGFISNTRTSYGGKFKNELIDMKRLLSDGAKLNWIVGCLAAKNQG